MSFFVSVGPNLAKKIPKQDISPLSYTGGKNVHAMFLEPVSLEEVTNIF